MPKIKRKVIHHPPSPCTNNDGVSASSSQPTITASRREAKEQNDKWTHSFCDALKYNGSKDISKSMRWMSWPVIIILSTALLVALVLRSMKSAAVLPLTSILCSDHASKTAHYFEGSNSSDTCLADLTAHDSSYDAIISTAVADIRAPEACTLVMAPAGISNAGWGVFTLTPRKRGEMMTDQGCRLTQVISCSIQVGKTRLYHFFFINI